MFVSPMHTRYSSVSGAWYKHYLCSCIILFHSLKKTVNMSEMQILMLLETLRNVFWPLHCIFHCTFCHNGATGPQNCCIFCNVFCTVALRCPAKHKHATTPHRCTKMHQIQMIHHQNHLTNAFRWWMNADRGRCPLHPHPPLLHPPPQKPNPLANGPVMPKWHCWRLPMSLAFGNAKTDLKKPSFAASLRNWWNVMGSYIPLTWSDAPKGLC